MSRNHTEILDWIAQGRVHPDGWSSALRMAGVTPGPRAWRTFLDQLSLWLGTIFCAAAVIFFLAFNWHDMGRYAKFGLVEILIVASLVLCWRLDLRHMPGKAALLMATLLVGALLALVGQTYQTGADTYELFAVWAVAVLAWVVIARLGALWLLWLALLNLSVIFYFQTFGGLFGFLFNTEEKLWVLFALNTAALVVWESAAQLGVAWLRDSWSVRILATASGGLVTTLMVWTIVDFNRNSGSAALLAYCVWMAAAYFYYRQRVVDVFVLAGGVLSVIIVSTTFLAQQLLKHDNAGGFLLIGLLVIGMSAAGGFWLKAVAAEART